MDDSIAERIKSVRKKCGLNQREFGRKLNVSLPTVNRIENGHRTPDAELIKKIWDLFGADLKWLLTGQKEQSFKGDSVSIPLLKKIPRSFDEIQGDSIEGYLSLPSLPEDCMSVRLVSEEMAPLLRVGDFVIFRKGEIADGDLGLLRDEGGKGRVRRYRHDDGGCWIAENPDYPPLREEGGNRAVGPIVQVVRVFTP